MKKVFSGVEFKKWFASNRKVRRVLTPSRDSFHILNLDEIYDDEYYIVKDRDYGEVIIEEVQFMG